MTAEDIRLLLKRRPFKPFRITVTTSETFDVYHPEMLIVGRSIVAVGLAKPSEPKPIADHVIWLDLTHIFHIQPLETQVSPAAGS